MAAMSDNAADTVFRRLVGRFEGRMMAKAQEVLGDNPNPSEEAVEQLDKEIGPSMLYAVACELAYLQSRIAELEREKADVN